MKMKKIAAAALAAVMVLSMAACADSESPNDGTGNVSGNIMIKTDYKAMWKVLPEIEETPIENLIYEYDVDLEGMAVIGYKAQSPKVRIPDKIEGEPVVGVNLKDSTITEIIMPDTVKRAVLNKTCLQYANYPFGLEAYGEISSYQSYSAPGSANEAFSGSTIEAVYIPNGVKYIPSSAFRNCSSLKEIHLPNSVTEINDYAFYGCNSLMSITLSDNLSYVAASSFSGGENYEDIVLTYKGKKYTSETANDLYILINFRDGMQIRNGVLIDTLEDITEAVIPNTVTKIDDSAFSNRKNLRSVTIPDSVTEISSSAFFGSVNAVVTYKGKTYDWKHIGVLYDAINLGESGMLIEDGVLKDVSMGLTEVIIPDSVTSINVSAFNYCTSLTDINVADSNPNYCSVDGVLYSKDKTTIIKYPGGKSGSFTIPDSVTRIDENAFSGCTSLTSVTIGNGVTEIGYDTFSGCTSLTNVIIGNGVTKIFNRAFKGCTSLTSVTIPDSITEIDYTYFDDCKNIVVTYKGKTYDYNNLEKLSNAIYFGESGMHIEDGVLKGVARNLTEIVIPNNVTEIAQYAFNGCENINVIIPDSVTRIDENAFSGCKANVTIANIEFLNGCRGVTGITIADGATEVFSKDYAKSLRINGLSCDFGSVETITIPSSVTSINCSAFYEGRWSSLTSINVADGAGSADCEYYSVDGMLLDKWRNNVGGSGVAFDVCPIGKRGDITIPNNVTLIAPHAFKNSHINSVEIPDSVTDIWGSAFEGCSANITFRGETYRYKEDFFNTLIPDHDQYYYEYYDHDHEIRLYHPMD